MYIYIYIHVHICICIYIYTHCIQIHNDTHNIILYVIILYYIILYLYYIILYHIISCHIISYHIILYYIILYYIIYSSIKVQQDLINDITLRVFKFKLIQIDDSMTWVSSIQAPTVLAPYAPAAGRDFVSTVPPGCWQGPSG